MAQDLEAYVRLIDERIERDGGKKQMTNEQLIDEQGGEPTRSNITERYALDGKTVELEWDSIHSVEITNTTKEGPRVSKVKLYGSDPTSVAEDAAILFIQAERHLERYLRMEEAIIQDDPDEASANASSDIAEADQTDG